MPSSGGQVPEGAVTGGQDGSDIVYIARANHAGEIIPGKVRTYYSNDQMLSLYFNIKYQFYFYNSSFLHMVLHIFHGVASKMHL